MPGKTRAQRLRDQSRGLALVPSPPSQTKSNGGAVLTAQADADQKLPEDLIEAVVRYTDLSVTRADRMGVWIRCPLIMYDGLEVLIRTNNAVRIRDTGPTWMEPKELRKLIADEAALLTVYKKNRNDEELLDRLNAVNAERMAAEKEYMEQYHREQTRWLSLYVRGFANWPFTDVPAPDPDNPDSYYIFHTDFEDLYSWLLREALAIALRATTKNLSTALNKHIANSRSTAS